MRTIASRWAAVSVLALLSTGPIKPASAADGLDGDAGGALAPTWTGFHAGVGGGYGAAFENGEDDAGAILISEAGFDFQPGERVVVGVLGDYTWTSFDGAASGVSCLKQEREPAGDTCPGSLTVTELDNMWTLAGRFGFLSSPQTLWYGLAGWTHADLEVRTPMSFAGGVDFVGLSSAKDENLEGITAGLGVESRLTDALSLKLEYRYTDFAASHPAGASVETQFDLNVQTVRGVLSWRFDLRCGVIPCTQRLRAQEDASLSSIRRKAQLAGCAKVLRAPARYSAATVRVCEIATSL